MDVLVTGGAGYIGTTLIPQLLDEGYKVTVVDNLMFGGDALFPFFRNKQFSFIKGDIRDKSLMASVIDGKDVIVHLAAIVGYPACRTQPLLAESVNIGATETLSCLADTDQLILFGSTGSNYGAVEEICTEEMPLNPLSLYGVTKTFAENHLLDNNPTIAYRFATAFGISPRLRLDLLINDFTYRGLTQGYVVVYESHFMRTFIHVHDIARAFVFAIKNRDNMTGQVFNVGSDKMNYSKKDVCQIIQTKTETYFHYADIGEDADKRNYRVSYEKINSLGFDTTITIEEGIDELIEGFKAVQYRTRYTNI